MTYFSQDLGALSTNSSMIIRPIGSVPETKSIKTRGRVVGAAILRLFRGCRTSKYTRSLLFILLEAEISHRADEAKTWGYMALGIISQP